MDKRKQFIIECRIKRMTYASIGKLLGISYQRVMQIEGLGYTGIKPVEKIKNWSKRKRESLGFPSDMGGISGGLDFIREIVRARDKYTCQKCLRVWKTGERRFDVHHLEEEMENKKDIKYDRKNMDKLTTLCHKCHLNLHSVRRKMSKVGRISKGKKKLSTTGTLRTKNPLV